MSTYATTPRPPRVEDRTPDDWLDILLAQLTMQAATAQVYEAYYDGRHPLQFATSKFREAFGTLFGAFADNWCQIVVDAPVERLKIVGFQKGGTPNDQAWTIWQDNDLDTESVIAHTEAGKCGQSFLLVDPTGDEPKITVEHAGQMVVIRDPAGRRERLAALKRWLGDDGYVNVYLYLPDLVIVFESSEPAVATVIPGSTEKQLSLPSNNEWVPKDAIKNTLGVVPVIPLENKPGLMSGGHSDLEPAVPLQNAINKICTDMIVASEYGAFRQRALTGVDLPKDPNTGEVNPSVQLKATMSRLWNFEEDTARVWDLNPTELGNYVNAINLLIQHFAAQTRTPPHYLLGQVVNASGEALIAAEAGLTTKCRAKILFFSDAWEEAMALALGGDVQADLEAIWDDPERVPPSVIVDACVKKKSLGVPLPILWREMGYTPEQIAEMEKLEESAREEQLALVAAQAAAAEKLAGVAPPVTEKGPPQPGPAPPAKGAAPPGASPAPPPPPPSKPTGG